MSVDLGLWIMTCLGLLGLLVIDFVTSTRKPHEVSFKEATFWSVFYIAVAVLFGVWVWSSYGATFGTEYFSAYLVEKSLSVDNLFVFAIILTQFAVPAILHQRVLLAGVILALVMRAIFIAIGAAALQAFAFTFVLFGLLLIWTGYGLMRHWDQDPDPSSNFAARIVRRFIKVTDEYHGTAYFIKEHGKRVATPMLLVMAAIAGTDLLFALDSIPATFGVTQEPYLVFTANAFALLGLRALYFLLKGLLDRLIYLSLALSFILIFIGIKLILVYVHEIWTEVPKISTNFSLIVILLILTVGTIASLVKSKSDPTAVAHAGTITGHEPSDRSKSHD